MDSLGRSGRTCLISELQRTFWGSSMSIGFLESRVGRAGLAVFVPRLLEVLAVQSRYL